MRYFYYFDSNSGLFFIDRNKNGLRTRIVEITYTENIFLETILDFFKTRY